MANDINTSLCFNKSYNVGVGRCLKEFGVVKGLIAVPKTFSITTYDIATLKTLLTDAAVDDDPTHRIYPLSDVVDWVESNGDPVSQSFGLGSQMYIRDGNPIYTCQFYGLGFGYHVNLRDYTNSQHLFDFLIVHADNTIGGVYQYDDLGNLTLKGISFQQVWTLSRTFATGSAVESYRVAFSLNDTTQVNEHYGYIECDFDVFGTILPLTNVRLRAVNSAATKYLLYGYAGYTNDLWTQRYATELTAGTTAFIAQDLTANTTLTISAVAAKPDGSIEVTLSAAPTSGHKILFKGAAPSVLEGLGISNYEVVPALPVTQP